MNHDIRLMCRVLDLSHATYYRWAKDGGLPSGKRDAALLESIQQCFHKSSQTYGSHRIHEALKRRNIPASRMRVNRIMQENGLHAARPRRRIRTTNSKHAFPVAPNLLARNFAPVATPVNFRWAGDITFIWTDEAWLYLAVILDLTSRRVIGFATSENIDRHLALDALRMAAAPRKELPAGIVFHSDRGSTYAATEYRKALTSCGNYL